MPGGLIYYGANVIEQYRRAASYVDRILKGEGWRSREDYATVV